MSTEIYLKKKGRKPSGDEMLIKLTSRLGGPGFSRTPTFARIQREMGHVHLLSF